MSVANAEAGGPLFRIVHPSDFSRLSQIAFAHALKIALLSHAELEIVHVEGHKLGDDKDVHWTDFPGVRATPSGGSPDSTCHTRRSDVGSAAPGSATPRAGARSRA